MTITPQDIQNKEFREAFRGYNQAEVDLFLDEVLEEYARLHQENQRLRIQIATMQQEAAQRTSGPLPTITAEDRAAAAMPAPSPAAAPTPAPVATRAEAREEMKRALVATQKAAEAALEEAKRRAAEIVARAEQRAKEIDVMTARRAQDVDGDAGLALAHAQQRVEELKKQEAEIKTRLRRLLGEHVRLLQQLEQDASAEQSPAPPGGGSKGATPAPGLGSGPSGSSGSGSGSAKAAGAKQAPSVIPPVAAPPASPPRTRGNGNGNGNGEAKTRSAAALSDSRAAVVERMARELGDAAAPPEPTSQRTELQPRDTFWRR